MMNSKRLIILLSLMLAVFSLPAQRSTTYTYTPNPKGAGFFTRTGDAYLPEFTFTELELKEPQDLYIDGKDLMYIADTGNRRIVLFDIREGRQSGEILHEDFVTPSGVWVNGDGILYVADGKAKSVFCFSPEGELVRTYTRPNSAAFGDRDFAPRKIGVDDSGSMFIVGEGLYDGVIQLSPQGDFLGYFTSNKVSLTFVERLQDLLFTDAQKANLLDRSPITFSNLFVDSRNILYTTSIGNDESYVKKHNAAGAAIVEGGGDTDRAPLDLWVTEEDIIIAVFADGETVVYSREGEIIATWGYSYEFQNDDVVGLFRKPSSVAMDTEGALWYLDEESSFLQSYSPTDYVLSIYKALDLFEDGEYAKSIEIWKEVLKVNQISRIAHLSIGKNYLFLRDYERAMYHTRIANSRTFYSDSFWEIRNIWLQSNVIYLVVLIILLFTVGPIYRAVKRRIPAAAVIEKPYKAFMNLSFVDAFFYQLQVLKTPNDAFYYIRKGLRGSMPAAVTNMVLFFIVFLLYVGAKGFIYQEIHPEDIDFASMVIGFFGGIFLFLLSNYLGTSIHDGRGDMRDLFLMFSYTLAPLIISMSLVIGFSYFLTLNEVFVLQLFLLIGWVWWFVNLVLGLREVHEYSTGAALMSIVFSLAFMLVLIIVLVIIWVMGQQVFQFFQAIAKELIRNVS